MPLQLSISILLRPTSVLDVRYNYFATDVVVKFQITIMNCFLFS